MFFACRKSVCRHARVFDRQCQARLRLENRQRYRGQNRRRAHRIEWPSDARNARGARRPSIRSRTISASENAPARIPRLAADRQKTVNR